MLWDATSIYVTIMPMKGQSAEVSVPMMHLRLCSDLFCVAACPACSLLNEAGRQTCTLCSNILPSGPSASDLLFESPMAPRPKPIKSTHLDAAAIQQITEAIVRAVAVAVPTVPEAVAHQVRIESQRAVKDISVASSAARRLIQSAVRDGLETLSSQMSAQDKSTQKLLEARALVVERSWLGQSTGGLFFCLVCTKHASLLLHAKQQKSEWIAGNCGVNPNNADSPFKRMVHSHEESAMHKLSVGFENASNCIDTALAKVNSHAEEVTVKLL